MKVIPPITLNSTNITSNAPTDLDPAEWNSSGSYAVGDKVKVTTGTPKLEKVYQCIVADPTSDYSPEVDVLRSVPKWVEIGSTNKYAMFDLLRDTQTISSDTLPNEITVNIIPGQSVNSLACLGMTGVLEVEVYAHSSSVLVYGPNIFDLNLRFTDSWYTYFYGIFRQKTACILFDLPSQYTDLNITVKFRGNLSFGVGACVVGNYLDIGSTQLDVSVEVLNFSSVDRDTFGTALLVPRRNVPKTSQKLYIDKSRLSEVISIKNDLDAVPAVWSGLDDEIDAPYFDSLLILGFYRTFDFDINSPIGVFIDLQLEEI